MPNWTKTLIKYHAWAHPSGEYELVLGTPSSDSDLIKTEEKLGIEFPKEFRDLYLSHNSFGFTDSNNKLTWSFLPLNQLPAFIEKVRSWFNEEQPALADRFFPFFDWHDGGGLGYLLSESGKIEKSLYDFHPEQLSESSECGPTKLIMPDCRSIKKFLTP